MVRAEGVFGVVGAGVSIGVLAGMASMVQRSAQRMQQDTRRRYPPRMMRPIPVRLSKRPTFVSKPTRYYKKPRRVSYGRPLMYNYWQPRR